MPKNHFLKVLALGLAVSLILNGIIFWRIYGPGGWRDEVFGLAGAKATREAMDDYRNGRLRIYRIEGESDRKVFTGNMEGVFEVWSPIYHPEMGGAHRYSTAQFVEFYNRKMRYMHSHPEQFPELTAVDRAAPTNSVAAPVTR